METKKILIINGPNLNMLGTREPEIYGSETLGDINGLIKTYARELDIKCEFFQSNCEGDIVSKIHTLMIEYDGCLINAGA